jgi:hypothetical protein
VGARATGTCGTPGAALSREVGARAVGTRGAPGSALRRETGTTPLPPLPRPSVGGQGVALSRSGRRCFYLATTLLKLPPPLPSTTSTTTSTSAISTSKGYHLHVVLADFYSSHNIRAITMLQLRGMSIHRILPLTYSPALPSVELPL